MLCDFMFQGRERVSQIWHLQASVRVSVGREKADGGEVREPTGELPVGA